MPFEARARSNLQNGEDNPDDVGSGAREILRAMTGFPGDAEAEDVMRRQ